MTKFTIPTPKEFENIFLEFEYTLVPSLFDAEGECYEKEIEIIDGMEYVQHLPLKGDLLTIMKEKKTLETNFNNIVKDIINHLIEQLEKYDAGKLGSFFYKNKNYFNEYKPENRKQALLEGFLYGLYPGHFIHNNNIKDFVFDNESTELAKYVYELYNVYYQSLYNEFEKIIPNYLNQPQLPKTKQDTATFTNNFDNIKPTEIYNHFKAGLVDKGYLTEHELNEYLKAAFELKTKPETLFKLKHTPTKQNIYTVFYIYYKDISQKKHDRQKEYSALLGDYFEGYKTEIIQTNWARGYKTKR